MSLKKYMLLDVEFEVPPPEFGNVPAEEYTKGIVADITHIPGVNAVSVIDQGDAEEIDYNDPYAP